MICTIKVDLQDLVVHQCAFIEVLWEEAKQKEEGKGMLDTRIDEFGLSKPTS